jgi:hypothetical protein
MRLPWLIVVATVVATQIIGDNLGLTWWFAGGGLVPLGVAGYVANVQLILYYIRKNLPGLIEIDMTLPRPPPGGKYLWERTAGTGIVPRWVSLLAFIAYGCFISGALFLVTAAVRLIRGFPTTPP